jgi:Immunity protein Imm1
VSREAGAFDLYTKMKYRLRLNGHEYFVAYSQELKQLLAFAVGQASVEFELTQISEQERKPQLITRLLAPIFKWDLSSLNNVDEIWGLINGNLAVLSYCEHRGHIFHSVNSDYDGPEDIMEDMVAFHSIDGGERERPRKWVISTEKAIEATLRFYEDGKRPDCIQWGIEI